MLRTSLLGESFTMPQSELNEQDVQGRWQKAAREMPETPDTEMVSASGKRRHSRGKTAGSDVHVMFNDDHLDELKPSEGRWRSQVIGKGSYGTVYRATWRGQEVAIKEMALPEQPHDRGETARKAFKKRVQAITEGFVKEVLVCCDLAHPNLVRMMGYSANPRSKGTGLCLVQEFLEGKALDHQLYVEGWRPNELQVLKAAVDVARGMRHLHHHFQIDGRPRPVVHRDLKSPNLLLTSPPPRSSLEPHAEIKITDFGLTRDKEMEEAAMKTGVMTGCGSVLWMAPEILLAGTCASQA